MLTVRERAAKAKAQETLRRINGKVRREARAKRPPSPKRHRRQRDPGFLAYLRRQPCEVGPIGCFGVVEAAHIRFGLPGEGPTGLQRKPDDRRACPLCSGHHREGPDAQHRGSERAFWAKRGIDPHERAAGHYARYQALFAEVAR